MRRRGLLPVRLGVDEMAVMGRRGLLKITAYLASGQRTGVSSCHVCQCAGCLRVDGQRGWRVVAARNCNFQRGCRLTWWLVSPASALFPMHSLLRSSLHCRTAVVTSAGLCLRTPQPVRGAQGDALCGPFEAMGRAPEHACSDTRYIRTAVGRLGRHRLTLYVKPLAESARRAKFSRSMQRMYVTAASQV
jgi:hypothetical protein